MIHDPQNIWYKLESTYPTSNFTFYLILCMRFLQRYISLGLLIPRHHLGFPPATASHAPEDRDHGEQHNEHCERTCSTRFYTAYQPSFENRTRESPFLTFRGNRTLRGGMAKQFVTSSRDSLSADSTPFWFTLDAHVFECAYKNGKRDVSDVFSGCYDSGVPSAERHWMRYERFVVCPVFEFESHDGLKTQRAFKPGVRLRL